MIACFRQFFDTMGRDVGVVLDILLQSRVCTHQNSKSIKEFHRIRNQLNSDDDASFFWKKATKDTYTYKSHFSGQSIIDRFIHFKYRRVTWYWCTFLGEMRKNVQNKTGIRKSRKQSGYFVKRIS